MENEREEYECCVCGQLSDMSMCYACQDVAYYEGWEYDND